MEIFILGLILLLIYVVRVYNRLKPKDVAIHEAGSNVDVILQKRTVIIDRLNAIVNTYENYEKDIVYKLSNDMTPTTDTRLSINRLYDVYPDLKLNDAFFNQMQQLYEIESERQKVLNQFNFVVKLFNEDTTQFPTLLVSNLINLGPRPFFR
jgi:hypothetical protein